MIHSQTERQSCESRCVCLDDAVLCMRCYNMHLRLEHCGALGQWVHTQHA